MLVRYYSYVRVSYVSVLLLVWAFFYLLCFLCEHMACCVFVGPMCSPVYCLTPPSLLPHYCFSGSTCVSPSLPALLSLPVFAVLCWFVTIRMYVCRMCPCCSLFGPSLPVPVWPSLALLCCALFWPSCLFPVPG